MQKYEMLLNQTILLQELHPNDIHLYIKEGRFKIKSYKKNTVIHFEGEPCNRLEIILTGEIVVERLDESGGLLTIAKFTGNDILGGNLLFSKTPSFPMTITAQQPSTIVEIEKELLFNLFVKSPPFLRRYLEYVSDHTSILGYKIKHYVNKTIRESLMSFLNHESKIHHSKRIELNMTKKALAEKIGVQRTSLSRELAKMKKDGLIQFDSDSITIIANK
jgi:CRP-like cAMP-binding protein